MDRATELSLLDELAGLKTEGSAFLDETVTKADVTDYTSQDRFDAERTHLFRTLPVAAAHSSELPDPGSFLTRDLFGSPLLLTRDKDGQAHAFLNVCRHRGARLVNESEGCKHSFSCPYHAWTYGNNGALRGVPHQKQGFPDIDKPTHGLVALTCAERFGFVWVVADPNVHMDIEDWLAPLAKDLDWIGMDKIRIQQSDTLMINANWKLLIEGGIEAYHFKVAHKDTIGPYFEDNLSSYAQLGNHLRSVLPRSHFADMPRDDWDIRRDANLLYSVLPTSQFLVQQDHVAWVEARPIGPGQTELRLSTVGPDQTPLSDDPQTHRKQNHRITVTTLSEDFEIGEGIQAGLSSGANQHLTFGRYEGALNAFADLVNARIEAHMGD